MLFVRLSGISHEHIHDCTTNALHVKGNKDGEDYDGGRDVDDFVSFINEKSGTNRDAKGQLTVKVSNQQCSDFIFYSSFMVCSILCSLVGWFSC